MITYQLFDAPSEVLNAVRELPDHLPKRAHILQPDPVRADPVHARHDVVHEGALVPEP